MRLPLLRVADRPPAAAEAGTASDEELAAAARSDPLAFAPLYQRYLDPVYRYCYGRLGEREAAEDATSEVFMKAFANLHRFRGGIFAAWLYTIARNVLIDHHRQHHATESLESAERDQPPLPAAGSAEEDRLALLTALAELPEEQRAVLELQFAGWPGEKIAAMLGKSPAATRMIRHRAVERLQQLLDPNGRAQGGSSCLSRR